MAMYVIWNKLFLDTSGNSGSDTSNCDVATCLESDFKQCVSGACQCINGYKNNADGTCTKAGEKDFPYWRSLYLCYVMFILNITKSGISNFDDQST